MEPDTVYPMLDVNFTGRVHHRTYPTLIIQGPEGSSIDYYISDEVNKPASVDEMKLAKVGETEFITQTGLVRWLGFKVNSGTPRVTECRLINQDTD